MNKPLVSVIIPTYNRNDLLANCLERLSTAYQNIESDTFEVIITDDSKENSAEEFIYKQYPWARWKKGPQRGPAANRNNGAKFANGDWLIFTDDDCLPEAGWLNAYIYSIEAHPETKVFEGKTICKLGFNSPMQYAPTNHDGGNLWSCNMMIHKDVYQMLNGFDENFPYPHMEDNDLNYRIKEAGISSIFVSEAVVDHPPRRLPSGKKLGLYQESYWYYFQSKRGVKVSPKELIWNVIKLHLTLIKRQKISTDSIDAFVIILEECWTILKNHKHWDKKYPVKKANAI